MIKIQKSKPKNSYTIDAWKQFKDTPVSAKGKITPLVGRDQHIVWNARSPGFIKFKSGVDFGKFLTKQLSKRDSCKQTMVSYPIDIVVKDILNLVVG